MKTSIIVLLFLILLPISSASVTREFTWNGEKHTESFSIPIDSTDRNVTITLTPSPFSEYDSPGYYVTESLPSSITLYNTNADWSDLTDRTLNLLKFMPSADNPSITYTIGLDKEKQYDFFGTYKDDNKNVGDIPTQTITVESKPIIDFSNIWEPEETEQPIPVVSISDTSEVIPINASQKPQSDNTIPIVVLLLIVNSGLGYLIYKKYYAKKPVQPVQKPKIDELSMIESIRKSLKLQPIKEEEHLPQQKPQETFEIIGDDDDEPVTIKDVKQGLRENTLREIDLLKKIRTMNLEDFRKTNDPETKQKLMDNILEFDKEIENLKRKL